MNLKFLKLWVKSHVFKADFSKTSMLGVVRKHNKIFEAVIQNEQTILAHNFVLFFFFRFFATANKVAK